MTENRKHFLVLTILGVAVSSVLFLFLYFYDNKYTKEGIQPIHGLLCLDNRELSRVPLRYLIYDWEYYPDALLTPEDFEGGGSARYCRHISIGQYGGMEMGETGRSTHGCGTYRLILELPDNKYNYTLELPEIYSAYRLYIGDELLISMGNPDKDGYKPALQKRMISFRGSGYIQLLIAVSDYSHFYSGMISPPAFGLVQNVTAVHQMSLLLRMTALTVAVVACLIAFYLCMQIHSMNNICFVMLPVCLIGYTLYPVIGSLFTTGLQPWYTLQLTCYYFMMFFVAVLYKQISGADHVIYRLGLGLLAAGCVVLMLISVFIGSLDSYDWKALYSVMGSGVKWLTVVLLLAMSVPMVLKNAVSSYSLYLGAVSYTVSLVFDRVFPLYEPVFGGWFPEIGGLMLLMFLLGIIWSELTEAYQFQIEYAERTRQMDLLLQMQRQQYAQLTEKVTETRRIRHDMRQHMRLLRNWLQEGNIDLAQHYLDEYENSIPLLKTAVVLCENQTADAVIQYYKRIAEQKRIAFYVSGEFPQKTALSDVDISVILGNLLENAIDAQQRGSVERKEITLHMQVIDRKMTINITNYFSGRIREKEGKFYSSNHTGFGVGTESVSRVVQSYGGMTNFSYDGDQFTAKVFWPM